MNAICLGVSKSKRIVTIMSLANVILMPPRNSPPIPGSPSMFKLNTVILRDIDFIKVII